jgi:creatinine amidohydrolase
MAQAKDDRPAERRISRLNWMEFAEWVPDPIATVLVPIGTLEAHGITSLGTDNEIPTRLAETLAERLNAFVAPTIPYGVTSGLGALAGGTHVKAAPFTEYVAAVLTTLTHQGFRNVLVMNGHGGNNEALRDALRRVHEETGAYVASFQWWTECYPIAEEIFGVPGGHAGVDETAAMMSIAPDQVFADRWDPSLAFEARNSLVTFPAPGSLVYYGGKRSDPALDMKKARVFWSRVVEHSGEVLEDLVVRWEREGFPAPRPRRAAGRGHVGHGGPASGGGGGGNGHDKSGSGAKKKSS